MPDWNDIEKTKAIIGGIVVVVLLLVWLICKLA